MMHFHVSRLLVESASTTTVPLRKDSLARRRRFPSKDRRRCTTTTTQLLRFLCLATMIAASLVSSFVPRMEPRKRPVSTMAHKEEHQRLVLVGGGHAHLQVIKALNHISRPQHLEVFLIDVTDRPCYSGMVPSAVSGIYQPSEPFISLRPLAEWSQIQFIKARVVNLDLETKHVVFVRNETEERLAFDAVSIDVGSSSRGLESVPGARDYAIPTRPISKLIETIESSTEKLARTSEPAKVLVVGGGAAGIELSMSLWGRWNPILGDSKLSVTILHAKDRLLSEETPNNRKALEDCLDERGISVVHNAKVEAIFPTPTENLEVVLESGETLECTHCLWATGAASHSELASNLKDLALSPDGWIRVNQHFQSVSHPFVFAAGDCCQAEIPGSSSLPKAGVYAVRAGPILIENLTRFLEGKPLKAYVPQQDFLKLLACGDGKALGFRFGIPIYGKWVFQLKDAIDRSFLKLFEDLPALTPGASYDTSQYDATREQRPPPMLPLEAAQILQRTDDHVDFTEAWMVLRDMAEDESYTQKVLAHMPETRISQESIAPIVR